MKMCLYKDHHDQYEWLADEHHDPPLININVQLMNIMIPL